MKARPIAVAASFAVAAVVALAPRAGAYDQYSENRNATNCRACHGDFRADGYTSHHDGQPWSVVFGGQTYTSLHNVHRNFVLSGDCSTCHFPSRFPVFVGDSAGGTGLQPIGCAGCHGRAEDVGANSGYGAGLRQHHFRSGVTVCVDCHDDADPVAYTPVAESTAPPYYFTPDPSHPNKPTDPCNPGGVGENVTAGPDALDNDGNLLYDSADPSCGNTVFADGFETGDTSRWSSAVPLGDPFAWSDFRAAAAKGAKGATRSSQHRPVQRVPPEGPKGATRRSERQDRIEEQSREGLGDDRPFSADGRSSRWERESLAAPASLAEQ